MTRPPVLVDREAVMTLAPLERNPGHSTAKPVSTPYQRVPMLARRPALAAELPTVSADGKTVTAKLRPSVTFHDGSTLTAQDVVFTYQSVLDPKVDSTLRSDICCMRCASTRSFYNEHCPCQGIASARPLAPLPELITDPDRLAT